MKYLLFCKEVRLKVRKLDFLPGLSLSLSVRANMTNGNFE